MARLLPRTITTVSAVAPDGRVWPVHGGRWGIQQYSDGEWMSTTTNMGYEHREAAEAECRRSGSVASRFDFRVYDRLVPSDEGGDE